MALIDALNLIEPNGYIYLLEGNYSGTFNLNSMINLIGLNKDKVKISGSVNIGSTDCSINNITFNNAKLVYSTAVSRQTINNCNFYATQTISGSLISFNSNVPDIHIYNCLFKDITVTSHLISVGFEDQFFIFRIR